MNNSESSTKEQIIELKKQIRSYIDYGDLNTSSRIIYSRGRQDNPKKKRKLNNFDKIMDRSKRAVLPNIPMDKQLQSIYRLEQNDNLEKVIFSANLFSQIKI